MAANQAPSSTFKDDVVCKWQNLLEDASRQVNKVPSPGPFLEQWVRDAGFVNVRHRVFKIPANGWPKDPKLKLIGEWMTVNTISGLEGFSLRLLCDVLGWKEEEVLVLLVNVRKQLPSREWHGYWDW